MATKKISYIAAAILRTKAALDMAKVPFAERRIALDIDTKLNDIEGAKLDNATNRDQLLLAYAKGDATKLASIVATFVKEDELNLTQAALTKVKEVVTGQVDVDDKELRTSAAGTLSDAIDKL